MSQCQRCEKIFKKETPRGRPKYCPTCRNLQKYQWRRKLK